MRSVKAIYENGTVTLLEPTSLKDKQQVTVLIPEEDEEPDSPVLRFGGMLSDLDADELAAFDRAMSQGLRGSRLTMRTSSSQALPARTG